MDNILIRDQVRRIALATIADLDVNMSPRARRELVTTVVNKLIEEKREFAIHNMRRAFIIILTILKGGHNA